MAQQPLNIGKLLAQHGYSNESIAANLADWHERAWSAIGSSDPATKFSGTVPLRQLSYDNQVIFMDQYREITGLNTVLNQLSTQGGGTGVENIRSNLVGARVNDLDNPFGRFNLDKSEDSLINRLYGNMNIQISDSPSSVKSGSFPKGFGVEHHFSTGSIPRLSAMERPTPSPVSLNGRNLMVFDIETAGFRPGGIREIAYQTVKDGIPDPAHSGNIAMRPMQGARGRMVSGGSAMPVDEFLSAEYGIGKGVKLSASGDDYLDKVLPWLNQALKADNIVGHNIDSFDISQIFQGIAGTKRYAEKPAFKAFIDESFDSINAKTIDTLTMARSAPNLANLTSGVAKGDSIYSIENLLLKTDLGERIGFDRLKIALGYDDKSGIFSKGLHHGDVDTLLTTGLLENMADLKQVDLGAGMSGADSAFARNLASQIQRSAAITPFTQIRDPSQIHRRVKALLGSDHPNITPIGQDILLSRRLGFGANNLDAVPSRNLLSGLGQFDRLIGRAGREYSDMYDEAERPSDRAFSQYQKGLKNRGMPFAGLSYEERLFGTAMSDITAGVADTGFSKLARESLTSRFSLFNLENIQYVTDSGKVTLPPQLLDHLGLLGKIDDPAMLSLSIVRPTSDTPSSSVNLAYKFQGMMNVEVAIDGMNRVASNSVEEFARIMGMDAESPSTAAAFRRFKDEMKDSKLSDALRASGLERGVSIAQLTGKEAEDTIALLGALNNTDNLRDESMLPFRLPLSGVDTDAGVVRTAGVIYDQGLQVGDRAIIGAHVAQAAQVYNPAKQTAGGSGFAGIGKGGTRGAHIGATARQIDSAVAADAADSALRRFLYIDEKIVPRIPKIVAGAAVLGVAAIAMSKKREMDKYDVAFEYSGQESGSSQYEIQNILQQRMEQGQNGYYRQIDPLSTASLTDNLYNSSIGHTSTQWDRSSALYGGII